MAQAGERKRSFALQTNPSNCLQIVTSAQWGFANFAILLFYSIGVFFLQKKK